MNHSIIKAGALENGTLGTRGLSRVRWDLSAEGRHSFGRRPKPRAAKPREKPAFRAGHYKDLTETGNRARKVSGTQGRKMGAKCITCDPRKNEGQHCTVQSNNFTRMLFGSNKLSPEILLSYMYT